ncbi:UNVERIFIED_CONTAM: hypothetical protein FKN15_040175 [Acipenser sinensis]
MMLRSGIQCLPKTQARSSSAGGKWEGAAAGNSSRNNLPSICQVCLVDEWCIGCDEFKHTVAICPSQYQGKELAARASPDQKPRRTRKSHRPQARPQKEDPHTCASGKGKEWLSPVQEEEVLLVPVPPGQILSQQIRDWLLDLKGDLMKDLSVAINLLWARDGKRREAWERQHNPASLYNITAMVLNYLTAELGEAPPCPAPRKGGEPERTEPKRGEPECPAPERELYLSPVTKGEQHQSPVTEGALHQSPVTEGELH